MIRSIVKCPRSTPKINESKLLTPGKPKML
jgi:hypothetical protein